MIYIIEILYGGVCVLLAWKDSVTIAKGGRVLHALNAATHLTVAFIVSMFFVWYGGFMILLVARIVFNTALNKFRKLPYDYVSADPKSIVDRIEKKIFGNDGIFPLVIYLVALIVLNIFYAANK